MIAIEGSATHYIVNVYLTGILIVTLAVMWFVSFCTVNRRSDPARWSFTWMKVAQPFLMLALISYVSSDVVFIVWIDASASDYFLAYSSYDSSDTIPSCTSCLIILSEIGTRLQDVGLLFESLADVFLLLCFLELALGILLVWSKSRELPTIHILFRFLIGVLALTLASIALGIFGRLQAYYTDTDFFAYNGDNNSDSPDQAIVDTLHYLQSAFDIVLFVVAVVVLVETIFILVLSRSKTVLRHTAAVFLAIAILYLLRNTWNLAYDINWVIPQTHGAPVYILILDPLLDLWPIFAILIILFFIGNSRGDGLYSEPGTLPLQQHQQQQLYPIQQYELYPIQQQQNYAQPYWQPQPQPQILQQQALYQPQAQPIASLSPVAVPSAMSSPPHSPLPHEVDRMTRIG